MKTLSALALLVGLWVIGLLTFADRVERSTPTPLPHPSGGIVALTGAGSNERIGAGVAFALAAAPGAIAGCRVVSRRAVSAVGRTVVSRVGAVGTANKSRN